MSQGVVRVLWRMSFSRGRGVMIGWEGRIFSGDWLEVRYGNQVKGSSAAVGAAPAVER